MPDAHALRARGEEIVRTLTAPPFLLPDGMLSRGRVRGKAAQIHILGDLGDYLPFFSLFGGEAFCREHVRRAASVLREGLLLPQESKFGIPVATTYEHSDLLLGLLWYASRTGDARARSLAEEVTERLRTSFRLGSGTRSFYLPTLRMGVPILDARDGQFLELFVDHPELPDARVIVSGLTQELLAIPLFRETGLFPAFSPRAWGAAVGALPRYRGRLGEFVFMKHNSNAVYGLLAAARKGDADARAGIGRWMSAMETHAVRDDGFVVHRARVRHGRLHGAEVHAASNHTAIDLFCDLAHALRSERSLALARRIADAVLASRGATGLFPLRPGTREDDLDTQTDTIVALVKLAELTGEARYREAATVALEAVLRYHRRDSSYALGVDVATGEVRDASEKTKFIALFLKALHLSIDGRPIYATPELHDLLKDR